MENQFAQLALLVQLAQLDPLAACRALVGLQLSFHLEVVCVST